ncbi:MAG: hypothetical protein RJQ09_07360 [Cyclobacteriaceae bacterium]
MRRNDIRFRRESLGRTRIEQHKDFSKVTQTHQQQRTKIFVRNVLALLAVLLVIGLIVYSSLRLDAKEINRWDRSTEVLVEHPINYPTGDLR